MASLWKHPFGTFIFKSVWKSVGTSNWRWTIPLRVNTQKNSQTSHRDYHKDTWSVIVSNHTEHLKLWAKHLSYSCFEIYNIALVNNQRLNKLAYVFLINKVASIFIAIWQQEKSKFMSSILLQTNATYWIVWYVNMLFENMYLSMYSLYLF